MLGEETKSANENVNESLDSINTIKAVDFVTRVSSKFVYHARFTAAL